MRDVSAEDISLAIQANGNEEKEKEKKTSKFKGKYVVPIVLIGAMLPTMFVSCGEKKPEIRYDEVPIDTIVYNIDNPHEQLEGIVNSEGQEGLTGNIIDGDTLEGENYSSEEQYKAEEQASSGVYHFEEMKEEISQKMDILNDENSTQEQKQEAIKRLHQLSQEAERIYRDNEPMAQEYAEKFKEISEKYEDSNTKNETKTVDLMYESYINELGLSEVNSKELAEIVELCEQGYKLEISSEQELDGDYRITGEAVKEIVENEDLDKSSSIWQKFVNHVRGHSDKGIEK